jgi:hypothetical protein
LNENKIEVKKESPEKNPKKGLETYKLNRKEINQPTIEILIQNFLSDCKRNINQKRIKIQNPNESVEKLY